MKEEQIVHEPSAAARPPAIRRISWQAIFAGVVVALAVELVLSVLGVSIGATAVNPTANQATAQNVGIGGAIWLIVVSIISLFMGGWVAGRVSGLARGAEGILHGFVTWGVMTLFMAFLLSALLGGLLSGMASMLRGAIPVATQAMSQATGAQGGLGEALQGATGGGGGSMQQELQTLSQSNPQLKGAVVRMLSEVPNVKPEDREAVVNMLVSQNHMSQDQANQTVDRWIQTAQQAKSQAEQKARQAGAAATKGVSAAGWWSFIMLVLSALAAAWGGSRGATAFLRSRPPEVRATA